MTADKIYPFEPFPEAVPTPGIEPDAGLSVCVQFSAAWRPYILGSLVALLAPQTWRGTQAEIDLAVKQANNLLGLFEGDANCDMITNIRLEGCTLQAFIDGAWVDVADLTTCSVPGEKGDKGDKGDTGDTGATGATGVPGEKGDKGDKGDTGDTGATGATGEDGANGTNGVDGVDGHDGANGSPGGEYNPPPIDGEATEQARCNTSTALALYVQEKLAAGLFLIKAGLDLANSVATIATDLIDTIPVFGGLISAAIDFVANIDPAHVDDLIALNIDPDWHEIMRCDLHCLLTDGGNVNADILNAWHEKLFLEPPQGPLLTVIGQATGLAILSMSVEKLQSVAYLYKDNDSICEDCDCGEVGDAINFTYTSGSSGPDTGNVNVHFVVSSGAVGGGGYAQLYFYSDHMGTLVLESLSGYTHGGGNAGLNSLTLSNGHLEHITGEDLSGTPITADGTHAGWVINSSTEFTATFKFLD